MEIKSPATTRAAHAPSVPCLDAQDMELTVKTVRGIADINAGRCAPIAEVRARILSRYEPSRACV